MVFLPRSLSCISNCSGKAPRTPCVFHFVDHATILHSDRLSTFHYTRPVFTSKSLFFTKNQFFARSIACILDFIIKGSLIFGFFTRACVAVRVQNGQIGQKRPAAHSRPLWACRASASLWVSYFYI
jgi:hypothetical protein